MANKIQTFGFHSSYLCNRLFKKDVPLKTVSKLLGHAEISITSDIYTHVMPKEKTTAVEKLNELFE